MLYVPSANETVAFEVNPAIAERSPETLETLVGVDDGGAEGDDVTVTIADFPAEPPLPVQVSEYVVVAARPPVLCEPEVAFVPDQPPEAVQELAFVEFHESVEELPDVIVLGAADSVIVGAGAVVVTVTVAD